MIGLIPKMLVDLVTARAGPEAAAAVRARAGVAPDEPFRIGEVYPDATWQALYAAAQETLGVSREDAERAFARWFYEDAVKRWPTWFAMSRNAREFLERQPVIHNCFATALHDPDARAAVVEKFRLERLSDGFVMHYRSPNRHCVLYEALAQEILHHYGEVARVEQRRCVFRGDDACEIVLRWPGDAGE
ncbi:MAG: heme NO-binding domain-containing protein [Myxococcota bacterium]